MSKNKIVFDERFEIFDQAGRLLKKTSLTVRIAPPATAIAGQAEKANGESQFLKEPGSQVYEMKFVRGEETIKKTYYAASIDDLSDLFVTMLQKTVDDRDAETTTVKLNPNNRYFTTKLIACPYCGTKLQRVYGFHRGLEIRCRRCKRIFTSGQIRK